MTIAEIPMIDPKGIDRPNESAIAADPPINAARTDETSDSIDAMKSSARRTSAMPPIRDARPSLRIIHSAQDARIAKLNPEIATRCCTPHAANAFETDR